VALFVSLIEHPIVLLVSAERVLGKSPSFKIHISLNNLINPKINPLQPWATFIYLSFMVYS
jgi:hypothetical protein